MNLLVTETDPFAQFGLGEVGVNALNADLLADVKVDGMDFGSCLHLLCRLAPANFSECRSLFAHVIPLFWR
uniref:Uncharacterized protein n=1 Tax=Rhizobium rhizogenes TaxID=359 RepID=A0A7S4ZSA2_RHIRH|nr:hypothetical protein pC6.5b_250 [Rhizobium rhizogenes]